MSLDDMRRITCLGSLHIREAVSRFADVCDTDGTITRSSFFKVLTDLSRASSQDEQLPIVLGNLYQIFDIDRNSIVDHAELVASLCVLCEGTSDEKAKIAFEAFTYVVFELNRVFSLFLVHRHDAQKQKKQVQRQIRQDYQGSNAKICTLHFCRDDVMFEHKHERLEHRRTCRRYCRKSLSGLERGLEQ